MITDREPDQINDDFIMEETIIFNECFSEEDDSACVRLLLLDPAPVDWDGYRDWAQRLE